MHSPTVGLANADCDNELAFICMRDKGNSLNSFLTNVRPSARFNTKNVIFLQFETIFKKYH